MPAQLQSGPANSPEKLLEQIDRIAASPVLQGSEALCNLLKYLARHSIEAPEVPVKEYQIATELFGRPANFDPRVDSTVRVQMSRLRSKLQEFYSTLGRDEPILVEIPRGTHTVSFREREAVPPLPLEPVVAPHEPSRWFRYRWHVIAALAAVAASVFAVMWQKRLVEQPKSGPRAVAPLAVFWRGILRGATEPLVVFSNAEFVGRPETGLRYLKPGQSPAGPVFDHYTGVGEVLSIHDLDEVLFRLGKPFLVKRGRLLNWDDTKNRDLIFLGSPSENLSLRELSLDRQFKFQTMETPPRKGDLAIVNLRPGASEQTYYFASKDLPITEDYALVELVTGTRPSRSILLLAGTTTFGTQGAVEYVCSEDSVRDLLPRVSNGADSVGPFTALLHLKINGGVPIETTVVALRRPGAR